MGGSSTEEGSISGSEEAGESIERTISFREFLETALPGQLANVTDAVAFRKHNGRVFARFLAPPIRIYCASNVCKGIRTFRCSPVKEFSPDNKILIDTLYYFCGDCKIYNKQFYLRMTTNEDATKTSAFKFGEFPPFGEPVPNGLLRLFGSDRETFLKGRRCENQGLGIGAFAYYRRVVENHRNGIFDAILGVCETIKAPPSIIDEIRKAKHEISFSKAMDKIKSGLPDALLINGHNPLTLLHQALSIGIHNETDEKCLYIAHDVRIILTQLAERMAYLRQNDAEITVAVERLLKINNRAAKSGSNRG